MIRSFRDRGLEAFWRGASTRASAISRRWPAHLGDAAWRKLALLDRARTLDDLLAAEGANLTALDGARRGQHAIGIDDRYRLCFFWRDGQAHAVEIVTHPS